MPSILRYLIRSLLILFLLQLPFTIWPACMSLLMGVPFAIYLNNEDRRAGQHWDKDMRVEFEMNRWDAILPVDPYVIPVLWSTEWQNQLGMMRTSYADKLISSGCPEHLEALPGVPSQWVYLPETNSDVTGLWDVAFDQLLQYHYIHPPANDALFSFLDANLAPFLETVWHVRRPALVFFNVADLYPDHHYPNDKSEWSREFRRTPQSPVSVHIAELPLPYHIPGHLISCFDQMLLLTNGTIDASTLPEWHFFKQAHARFSDKYEQVHSRSQVLRAIHSIDDWLKEHLPFLNSPTLLQLFYTYTINTPLTLFAFHNHYIAPALRWYTARSKSPIMIALHKNPYDDEPDGGQDGTTTWNSDFGAEWQF